MRNFTRLSFFAVIWQGANCEAYDYVIVGGGTCGLLLANRLSADPNVTVAIIDPGPDVRNNPNVTLPVAWLNNLGSSLDWLYPSVPQGEAGNRSFGHHAGKALGGSSAINGMTYIRADKSEINAWEALGNEGWNWDTLYPYYKKTEQFIPPTAAQVADGAVYNPNFHGVDGPVKVGFVPELDAGPFEGIVARTWNSLGFPTTDVNGGYTRGYEIWPMTVDPVADLRQDAATVFFWPVSERPNLTLLNGTARKILWGESLDACGGPGEVVATGVEYLIPDSSTVVISANKEVVLSAGALRTPLILEQSGIGNPSVLEPLGIEVKLDLPGVGENLQEQPSLSLAYPGTLNVTGYTPYVTFVTAQDAFGEETARIAAEVKANLSTWAKEASERSGIPANAIEQVLNIQYDFVFDKNSTVGELITYGSGTIMLSAFLILLPFSRGSVHLKSTDISSVDAPLIDPAFYWADFDKLLHIALGKLIENYWLTEPVKSLVANGSLSHPSTDAEWEVFIQENVSPNSHPLATAAMMAKELGGVVSPELKVYGTSNLRVVDASILPLQVSGHLTSTLYAVAERASGIIRAAG